MAWILRSHAVTSRKNIVHVEQKEKLFRVGCEIVPIYAVVAAGGTQVKVGWDLASRGLWRQSPILVKVFDVGRVESAGGPVSILNSFACTINDKRKWCGN